MIDLCIINARIVDEHGEFFGSLGIHQGCIIGLWQQPISVAAQTVIDAAGRVLMPGIVDAHVHFNQPGRSDWEGFETGSMSAAAGGVTTVIDMPLNNHPAVTDAASLQHKRQALFGQSLIDYGLWGGLVDNNLDQLEEQAKHGVLGFKAFMSASGIDDFVAVSDGVLYQGLQRASQLGKLVAVHAESDSLSGLLARQMHTSGRSDRAAWLESRPIIAELEAIRRVLWLAQQAQSDLHIVHVSSAEGVELVHQAKQQGQTVSCETCPHYLVLDSDDFIAIGPDAKCAPPLRDRAQVEALWQQVLAGKVDTIGSDHSPCPSADKRKGDNDIWQAWGGISGVQFMLPLLIDEGVHKRGLALPQLVRMLSAAPAQRMGLYPRKGTLQIGSDADLVLVDLDKQWQIQASDVFARHKHSPYIGRTITGKVAMTLVRGTVVYDHGAIIGQFGLGRELAL
jgi:allantoinase